MGGLRINSHFEGDQNRLRGGSLATARADRSPVVSYLSACRIAWRLLASFIIVVAISQPAVSKTEGFDAYEGRQITAIEIVFDGSQPDAAAEASFLAILKVVPNTEFSAVKIRDSLQALFDTQRVANARVEVIDTPTKSGPIRLRFVIQRQVQISEVNFEIAPTTGLPVSADELRARLSLAQPGSRLSKQIIVRSSPSYECFATLFSVLIAKHGRKVYNSCGNGQRIGGTEYLDLEEYLE